MTQRRLYPQWRDMVLYSAEGPTPQMLLETGAGRAMMAGLQAEQKVPAHPEGPAVYYFLEGTGQMIVDEERFAVQTGATVVVPDGSTRGIEAETQLAFLAMRLPAPATRAATKKPIWGASMLYALVAMIGLMIGGMILSAVALSSGGGMLPGMLRLMTASGSGGLGLGMWGLMLLPFVGILIMLAAMYLFYRRMASSGPMSGMMSHHGPMAREMGHGHAPRSQTTGSTLTTLTYNIPAVHCPHCKMRIERELSQLAGVSSVSVDVDARQAVIRYDPPATKTEIEERLAELGYPPQNPQ